MNNDAFGELRLGPLPFRRAGAGGVRHTLTPDGMTRSDAMASNLPTYTRERILGNEISKAFGRIWLNFLAISGRRARFVTAFENYGEVLAERSGHRRFFELKPSPVFSAHRQRLVIEWTGDTVNWAKKRASGTVDARR